MEEKELIQQLRKLKTIQPNKAWASFMLKSIVGEAAPQSNPFADFVRKNSALLLQRRFAYSFALFAFFVAFLSVAHITVPGDNTLVIKNLAQQSQATLAAQAELHENIASLNSKINTLAEASKAGVKGTPSVVNDIKANAVALKQSLKTNSANKEDVKAIADSLKTLANVSGSSAMNLTKSDDVKDLYKTLVESQINDLENSTLTDGQSSALQEIKELYTQEKYTEALEIILKMNN